MPHGTHESTGADRWPDGSWSPDHPASHEARWIAKEAGVGGPSASATGSRPTQQPRCQPGRLLQPREAAAAQQPAERAAGPRTGQRRRDCRNSGRTGSCDRRRPAAPREGATISASLGGSARRGLRDATPANERTDLAGSCAAQANPLVRWGTNAGPARMSAWSPKRSRSGRPPGTRKHSPASLRALLLHA